MTLQPTVSARPLLGIGWDVGGWIGKKQAVAVVTWDEVLQEHRWIGRDGGRHGNPFSLTALPPTFTLPQLLAKACPTVEALDIANYQVCLAVDAPFGFPAGFVDLLNGGPLPSLRADREISNPLAYRDTDRHVEKRFGKKPLSASFDKLGNNATVAMVHLGRWQSQDLVRVLPFDQVASDVPTAIEVYPALMKARDPWPEGGTQGPDDRDACLCALMALAWLAKGKHNMPRMIGPEALTPDIKREGWIYYPDEGWAPIHDKREPTLEPS